MNFSNLEYVPKDSWPSLPAGGDLQSVYSNGQTVVLEYHITHRVWFKSILIKHLAIRTIQNKMVTRFYDLMTIKAQVCDRECAAVQVYPPESEIMDAANMTHIFVYPKGYKLPTTLNRKW